MAKGISLHVGLNEVDPAHYSGWSGPLTACEADAEDMIAIADSCGFETDIALTRDGTRDRVLKFLDKAAADLSAGDIMLITYSGHGGQVNDTSGDEPDRIDETWCLYDGQLVDDELYARYAKFKKGVRVLVVSDSCHSGSVIKAHFYRSAENLGLAMALEPGGETDSGPPAIRAMPREVALRTYRQNREFYDNVTQDISRGGKREHTADVAASVRLISGCQDNQYSMDGAFNGAFTGSLLQIWGNGAFKGDYADFHAAIVGLLPPTQSPNHFMIGPVNAKYDAQKPFTI